MTFPAYSPYFNPAELIIRAIKEKVKKAKGDGR